MIAVDGALRRRRRRSSDPAFRADEYACAYAAKGIDMATEDDRAAAIAIFESGWNRGEFGGLTDICAEPFTFHVHGRSRVTDLAELRTIVAGWRRGFPDLRFDLHDVVAEDGRVAIRATLTGTHRGEWNGRPPTGNAIAVDHFFLLRFGEDVLVEVFEVLDSATLEQQLA